jgi:hypothetical protein
LGRKSCFAFLPVEITQFNQLWLIAAIMECSRYSVRLSMSLLARRGDLQNAAGSGEFSNVEGAEGSRAVVES